MDSNQQQQQQQHRHHPQQQRRGSSSDQEDMVGGSLTSSTTLPNISLEDDLIAAAAATPTPTIMNHNHNQLLEEEPAPSPYCKDKDPNGVMASGSTMALTADLSAAFTIATEAGDGAAAAHSSTPFSTISEAFVITGGTGEEEQAEAEEEGEEEKDQLKDNNELPIISMMDTSSHCFNNNHSAATTNSSVRFSLTDSNYSSYNGSNRSNHSYRNSINNNNTSSIGNNSNSTRSLELRKVPIDTSLLFGPSNHHQRDNTTTDCSKCSSSGAIPQQDLTHSNSNVDNGGGNNNNLMDNSDDTHTEDEEDDEYENCNDPSQKRRRRRRRRQRNQVQGGSCARQLLRSTCLRSHFSLQSQLLLSFGIVSFLSILLVMFVCVAVSILSGKEVNDLTRDSLEHLSYDMEGKIVRYVAEALSLRLLPDELVQIIHDATIDRFIGYPNHPGYENDTLTPYKDVYTQQNVYPIKGPTAGLDWELRDLVTPENAAEHVLNRLDLYQSYEYVSTAQAAYSFQGTCNPRAAKGDFDYYPNCTNANNDITTGGVVFPVATSEGIFVRSSDLTPIFKAIYEETPSMRDIGVCFANEGAGSTVIFPGYTVDGNDKYESIGCDWMREPNPYKPNQPIGTDKMIARCAPEGETVYSRRYNPLERGWCREQALNPDQLQLIGPFNDAWNNEVKIILVGKAIYDPFTLEFVGCMFLDFTLNDVQNLLEKISVTPNSHVSIVRWDEQGTVAASSALTEADTTKVQDLKVGITEEVYQRLFTMVDYEDGVWDPQTVRDIYANVVHHDEEDGYLVGAYPMPPVPDKYDPWYRPQWLVIMSVSTQDVLDEAVKLEEYVDDKVDRLVYFSLVAGVVGWGLVMFVILVVSQTLTLPLQSMNQATKDIVDNFGGSSENCIAYNAPPSPMLTKCAPETEISQVVCEFKKMVQKFSGSSKMAKAVQERFTELANHFSFEHEFDELYKSRQDGSFAYAYDGKAPCHSRSCLRSHHQHGKSGSHLTNFGTILTGSQAHLNLHSPTKKKRISTSIAEHPTKRDSKGKRFTSPLFLFIVAFIATPLLITTVTMSAIVTVNVSQELTEVIDDGKAEYVRLEKFALVSAAQLRANWIAGKTQRITRDLHIVTRYAGWLLFGGLERRDSFTELTTGTDECKVESNPMECQYVNDMPCNCLLNPNQEKCAGGLGGKDGEYGMRYLQETYFLCQSHDAMPSGDRLEALSFPDVSFSPATTAWWHNVTTVPGSEKGSGAEGYDTTYDRLRVLSAIPIFQTLYNYHKDNSTVLQSAVAMEADGMVVGYHGCSMVGEAMAAFWESTPDNHANDIRPELCPVGKFGFDPRCREWYDTGRRLAKEEEADLYVTGPYRFATDAMMGQTCTSPLVDPHTGEHVGQAFVDYQSKPMHRILSPNNTILANGFPILVAAHSTSDGANAIIGPGYEPGVDDPMPIERVILPSDWECSDPDCLRRKEQLQIVLGKMRSGESGTGSYTVPKDDGSEEKMFVAYAPVKITTFPSIDSSDFSRGVSVQHNTIFYLALTETEATLVAAFDQVEEDISVTIDIGIAILSVAIVVAVLVVIYISYWVAISITQPMLYLLGLIKQINEVEDNDEVLVDLDMQAGSKEVKSVANTMGTLHKIVRCANSAYFAGDIDKAYAVLTDSARLFKRLDNKKAVGVANNNLGNTMLAMYRVLRADAKNESSERFCGLTRREIVLKGLSYFHEAIQLGEKAYDEFYEAEGWSPSCLDFMQHLANRYFNRAMFLLTVKDDHDNPKELVDLGMRDLQIARDMDVEIVDQGTEVGWQINTADKLFKVALNRARGHLLLMEMGYPDEWDLEELLEELFHSLKKEMRTKPTTSELFQELAPAGRMQQVETELMRYKLLKGDLDTASKIAIRMLMEDEFILPEAQLKAVQVLIIVLKQSGAQPHVRGQLEHYELWLRRAKEGCDNIRATSDSTHPEDVSEVIHMSIVKMSTKITMEDHSVRLPRNASLLATTRGDVTMEIF